MILYDKIYREDILAHGYRLVRNNGGQAGVDGESFAQIEEYGVDRWLGELVQAVKEKRGGEPPRDRATAPVVRQEALTDGSGYHTLPLGLRLKINAD